MVRPPLPVTACATFSLGCADAAASLAATPFSTSSFRERLPRLLVAAIVRGEVYKQLFDFFVDARSPPIGAAHSSDPTENSHAETAVRERVRVC